VNETELFESAVKRTFVVFIRRKAGVAATHYAQQTCVVEAYSIRGAKQAAALKMQKGKFKHTRFSDWIFDSVEVAEGSGNLA
jgi:hypothetical protein